MAWGIVVRLGNMSRIGNLSRVNTTEALPVSRWMNMLSEVELLSTANGLPGSFMLFIKYFIINRP